MTTKWYVFEYVVRLYHTINAIGDYAALIKHYIKYTSRTALELNASFSPLLHSPPTPSRGGGGVKERRRRGRWREGAVDEDGGGGERGSEIEPQTSPGVRFDQELRGESSRGDEKLPEAQKWKKPPANLEPRTLRGGG